MKTVFVVQHLHLLKGKAEDVKIVGIYSSNDSAIAAVDRLKRQPGFRDHPRLIDSTTEDRTAEGFYIDEYHLDSDHWARGFVTV